MDKESLEQNRPSGNGILRDLYHEDAGAVRHALEKIGEMGKGDHEAMRALQDFCGGNNACLFAFWPLK